MSGFKWKHWDALAEELQDAYLETHELPQPPASTSATSIKVTLQNIETGETIRVFSSLVEAAKEMKVSVTKIKKMTLDNDNVYLGYRWIIG